MLRNRRRRPVLGGGGRSPCGGGCSATGGVTGLGGGSVGAGAASCAGGGADCSGGFCSSAGVAGSPEAALPAECRRSLPPPGSNILGFKETKEERGGVKRDHDGDGKRAEPGRADRRWLVDAPVQSREGHGACGSAWPGSAPGKEIVGAFSAAGSARRCARAGHDGNPGDSGGREFIHHRHDIAIGSVAIPAQLNDAIRIAELGL